MSERKSLSGGDWASISVFLVGSLALVLMGYGLFFATGGGSTGSAALGAALAGALGPVPVMITGAGIAYLGARAFLSGDRTGMVTGILGMLGIAIGLSVIAGSLSGVHGGSLGAATGGRVAEMTHAAVGVLLGAIVAFGAAYFAWMREDPAAAAKLAPARRATPAPPKGDDGVTAAESAMLFPVEREEEVSPARPIAPPAKPVKPLYPEDVRLKGEIPSGARPLTSTNALAAAPTIPLVPEPAVYRWTAPRAAADPTRIAAEEIEALADVAPPVPEFVPVAVVEEEIAEIVEEIDERPMPPRPTWETTGLAEDDEPVDAYGTPLSLVEKARRDRTEDQLADELADELEVEIVEPAPVVAARIPREIGEIAESETQAVLEAVRAEESLALDLEPTASAVEVDEADEPVVASAVAIETEVETGDEPVLAAVAEVEQAEEEAEVSGLLAEQESLLDQLRANNAAVRAEAGVQEEYDAFEAEVAAADAELEPVAMVAEELVEEELLDEEEELEETTIEVVTVTVAVVATPESELEEDADDEDEFEEEEELAAVAAEIATEPEAELAEDEDEEEQDEDEEPEPVAAVPAAAPRTKVAAAAPSLFDAVETEPQVVLKPKAAVPASRAEKAPGRGIDPEKKLLVEVGCMFVERGRVAVSMLQRQYDMDFDQACRVLDDLQEMGLIGPYMGGKNRDILLTKDQWMEKVGAGVD